jgi:hypothetical protein
LGPVGTAAVRGDNFSTGPKGGNTVVGVIGMITAGLGDAGVLGASTGPGGVAAGEAGVMGVASSFGVVGIGVVGPTSIGVQGNSDAGTGVQGMATTGFGVVGRSNGSAGVTGTSQSAAGVEGESATGIGVLGSSARAVGVQGSTSFGFAGVHGSSLRGVGVFAESIRGAGLFAQSPHHAVQGVSNGPAATSIGVAGHSDNGAGVQGDSSHIGVVGNSTQGLGGMFTGQEAGVVGVSDQGYAVVGKSTQGGAGLFFGRVLITGDLQVNGAKNAVIKHTDGSYRALFCVESAESMLQDYGETTLKGESVFVRLPSDFAPMIKRDKYQVFLTAYGPEQVYVRKRTREGFEIARHGAKERAGRASASGISVGYCIVGRRADLAPSRLPKVKLPALPANLTGPKMAKPPTVPALVRRQKPGAAKLPPRPKIATPNLKELAKSAPAASARTKTTT